MRIPCPFCGPRDLSEFTCLGDATERRPDTAGDVSAEAFADHLYLRANPAGPHREFWYHAQGCRGWLEVTRDTRTHEIHGAVLASEAGR
jgi:heterotetrameric sarcosine oxidase delta subunit